MSKWGKVEYKEFLKFAEGFEKLSKNDQDGIMMNMIQQSAGRFLQVVVDRTPKDTGELQKAWSIARVYKDGGDYVAEIVNGMPYATFVEYGHRTRNGGWVKGRLFVRYAIQDLERVSQKLLDQITLKKFKEVGLI